MVYRYKIGGNVLALTTPDLNLYITNNKIVHNEAVVSLLLEVSGTPSRGNPIQTTSRQQLDEGA